MIIDQQTRKELEFDTICEQLSQKAKENAQHLSVFKSLELVRKEHAILKEIADVYELGVNQIPHPKSDDIDRALHLLRIENGVLTLDELLKVYQLCIGTKQLIDYAQRNKSEYPNIYEACSHIYSVNDIISLIHEILDDKGFIKDDASPRLKQVRAQITSLEIEINKNFNRVLRKYKKDEIIGDIEETVLEDKRLLSVLSQHKRRVAGKVIGASARSTYTYIEPQENIELNKRLYQSILDEKNEIFAILADITDKLRSRENDLKAFQRLLVRFDLYHAKVLFGRSYQGVLPRVTDRASSYWQDAKHPLLFLKNEELGIKTIGQTIELSEEKRFLVISGPNAGGKSITLKTVGLLQVMFQSGLFVPCDDVSMCGWYNQILSDIGDNQSIENQLSTYSYRLGRMKFFLDQSNEQTLLLLDEFGSGSDPELGGALAEVFYEELYEKHCFAVITTHYTNIKILTAQKEEALNACMLFDNKELKPLYQLSIGQPGSSFTFEVAKINGIDESYIAKAKEKVSEQKLKIDELTVSLQKEKSKFKKVNTSQFKASEKAKRAIKEYENKLDRLQEKAEQQRKYFEQQNKFVNAGKKVFDLIKKHKHHKTNKLLYEAAKKFIAIEKNKVLKAEKPVVFNKKLKQPELPGKKVTKPVAEEIQKKKESVAKIEEIPMIEVGAKVRVKNHKDLGIVKEVTKKKVSVFMGNFVLEVPKEDVESV